MENDIRYGVGPKAAAASLQSPASRAPSNQNKPGSLSGPESRGSGAGRPPSAGISAWGENDDSLPDRVARLSRADSLSSGAATPRPASGPISGDGNLAQALLAARKAAEEERRSSSGSTTSSSGAALEQSQGPSSCSGSDSSAGAVGRVSAGGDAAGTRRGPGRLSRASGFGDAASGAVSVHSGVVGSPGKELMNTGAAPARDRPDGSEGEEDEDEAMLEEESAEPTVEVESTDATWPTPPAAAAALAGKAGAGLEGGAAGASGDLRGLLYSDDEGGDEDEDYQDLMTADDDTLFGARGSGRASRASSKLILDTGAEPAEAGQEAEGPLQMQPRKSNSGSSDVGSAVETAAVGGGSQGASLAAAEQEGSSNGSAASADNVPTSPDPTCLSVSVTAAATGSGADLARTAWGTDGGTLSEPPSSAPSPQASLEPHLIAAAASPVGHQGHDPLVSGHLAPLRGLGAAKDSGAARGLAPVRASTGPAAVGRGSDDPRVPQSHSHHHHQQQQPQHPPLYVLQQQLPQQRPQQQGPLQSTGEHGGGQYAPIPTALVGEGLRQHPPMSRRLYTPGQSNRSPVRGSGYVVSPAAVRPPSPPPSPSRAAHHYHYTTGPGRGTPTSNPSSMAVTATQLGRPRSPRDFQRSSAGGLTPGAYDPDAYGSDPTGIPNTNFGFVAGSGQHAQQQQQPQQHGGGALLGHPTAAAAGFKVSSALGGGLAHSGTSFGRFPPAAVQQFGGGQVYRSMPISQVAGNPSDEAQGGLGAVGAASAGGAGAAVGRSSNSPGRLSGRGGRQQPRAVALGPVSSGAFLGHMRDRHSISSAPARPFTSPVRSPRGSNGTSRSPKRVTHAGPLSPASATAVFGNGVAHDGADMPAPPPVALVVAASAAYAHAPLRTLAVPSLPPYVAPVGIRHCGFKPAAAGGPATIGAGQAAAAAAQLYSSSFSGSRQKATDERIRSVMVAKVIASVAAKEQQQQHFAGGAHHDGNLTMINALPVPQPSGAAVADAVATGIAAMPPFDSSAGGHLPGNLEGWAASAAVAAATNGGASYSAELQLQRKGSLPHLLAASYQAAEGATLGGGPAQHVALVHGHGPSHLKPTTPPPPAAILGPYGHAGRSITPYESPLPVVQHGQAVQGVRSMSFDVSRRAMSRA